MPCIDTPETTLNPTVGATRVPVSVLTLMLALTLAGCALERVGSPAPVLTARPAPAAGTAAVPQTPAARAATATPTAKAATAARLPAPGPVRSLAELRLQAARRIVAANPHLTYAETTPDVLLAIPVLDIELNADGTIRLIEVLRQPRQAKDTTQIAIDAVKRAAPFGEVSRLPRPWRFSETFLFNDERRFKPRSLDAP